MATKIDPKYGLPTQIVKEAQIQSKISELEKDRKQGQDVLVAMKSKYGQIFEDHCRKILEEQIRDFTNKDPKCQAVLDIMKSLGLAVNAAEYANKLLEEKFKQ